MNKIKRLSALALAVVLLVSMGLMASATTGTSRTANDGISTVSGDDENISAAPGENGGSDSNDSTVSDNDKDTTTPDDKEPTTPDDSTNPGDSSDVNVPDDSNSSDNNNSDNSVTVTPGSSGTSGTESVKQLETSIISDIKEAIDRAVAAGSTVGVVEIDGVKYNMNAFSSSLMRQLNEVNVDVVISYDYDGNHYVITIPAGQAPVEDDVPWCGPLYLYAKFIDTAVVTPIVEE